MQRIWDRLFGPGMGYSMVTRSSLSSSRRRRGRRQLAKAHYHLRGRNARNEPPAYLVSRPTTADHQTDHQRGRRPFHFPLFTKSKHRRAFAGFLFASFRSVRKFGLFSYQQFLALIRGFETLTHTYSPHTLGRIRVTQENTAWDLDCASSLG